MGPSADRGALPGSARSDRARGNLVDFQVPDRRRASLRYRAWCEEALGKPGRNYPGLCGSEPPGELSTSTSVGSQWQPATGPGERITRRGSKVCL